MNAETYGAISYNASLPMFNKDPNKNRISFFTPKGSLRYAPGHMRDIDDDNLRLNYSNIFALNKNSQLDVVEDGGSVALGLEFSNLDLKIAVVKRDFFIIEQVIQIVFPSLIISNKPPWPCSK